MFRTDLLSIIKSLDTVLTATGICHTSYVDCLLVRLSSISTSLAVNTVLRLLMMDSDSVRNIWRCISK